MNEIKELDIAVNFIIAWAIEGMEIYKDKGDLPKNIKLVKQALAENDELKKKEIPMKPQIFIQDWGFEIEMCPNCKGSIHPLKHSHIINKRGNYCDLCGQRLDWGNDNE